MTEEQISRKNECVKEIAKKLVDHKLALYLGAGVSYPSDMPGWKTIVSECCEELEVHLTDYEDNYYKLLDYYSIIKSREDIIKKFKNYISKTKIENSTLSMLSKLNFTKIWTTNFDNLIRDNLKQNYTISNVINNDDDIANLLYNEGVSVIKLNGDFDSQTQIINEHDFLGYENNFTNIYLNFLSELNTHSFLIIGSSLTDGLYLPALYKLYKGKVPKHTSYLFMELPCKTEELRRHDLKKQYLKQRYNIEAVEFETGEDVEQIIKDIYDLSSLYSCFISGSLPQDKAENQSKLEAQAREFCGILAKKFLELKIKVYSCFGMLIGYYIAFPITSYCLNHGEPLSHHLQMYPLDNKMKDEEMHCFRQKVIDKAKFFIVVGGSPSKNSGVYKEYEIAKSLNKVIIPVPLLGGGGEMIYHEMLNDEENSYPYLNRFKNALDSNEPKTVANAVVEIIKSAMDNQYR